MSRALELVDQCAILRGDTHYTFRDGPYVYTIARAAGKVVYRVTDGKETFEAPLQYAFGQGKAGQTYLFSVSGKYYESRVSYYAKIGGLDLTVGASARPASLTETAGRVMNGVEPRNCFGCHTTGARVGVTLQLSDFEAGVQCESCHGPGAAHIEAIGRGKPLPGTIRALKNMSPRESDGFCGACHRTSESVMTMGIKGVNNARFPAYRLTNSPCFSLDDRRISCTACHDPHGPLVKEDRYYDSRCTACHNAQNAAVKKKTCPVGRRNCTSCHMQKVEPPEAHHAFPDHWIRVVRPGHAYPD